MEVPLWLRPSPSRFLAMAVPAASSCWTKAVVASWVVDVRVAAVGAVGTPVRAGEARLAFRPREVWRSVWAVMSPVMEPQTPLLRSVYQAVS